MSVKWKAAIAGGTVVGIGLGGFAAVAAADEVDYLDPSGLTMQQSASAASPLGSPARMKVKGPEWLPENAVAGIGGATSVDSPFSTNSPGGFDSPASPASPESPDVSVDSPASANSPVSPASSQGGGDSPASAASPGSAASPVSVGSPASPASGGSAGS